MQAVANFLPMDTVSSVAPFTGTVVNFQFRTRAHLDTKDESFCLALPVGEWDSCDLVLDELGLVFDLRMGHTILFRSGDLTHFNLDFSGTRMSFILHTAAELRTCSEVYKGFGKTGHFIT